MPTQTIVTALVLLLCIDYSRGEWGLENLDEQINAQLKKSLSPLKYLGRDITEEVHQHLAPLNDRNFPGRINNDARRRINGNRWNPLPDNWSPLPDNWGAQLASQLAPLDNLGAEINSQVYEGLKPVRILESILKVKFGTGGTTVASYSPGGKRLVIKESVLYECDGRVSDDDGTCSVPLKKLNFTRKEDFCYSITKSIVNNWYCLGSTSSISTYFINGKLTCEGTDGTPVLVLKDTEYHKLCENEAKLVKYKYYTHLPLKDFGNRLECSGNNPQVCTYSETMENLISQNIRGSTIIIN